MNEKVIWDCLLKMTGNEFGTSAIMGNLMAESSLNPTCVTGIKDSDYVKKADEGKIDFAHDGHAFGLVQWCYYARKGGLQAYAQQTGRSVGHLQMQLEYLVKEMRESYKSVWSAVTTSKNIRGISDTVMLKYEKPANTDEAARLKRANCAQKFYDQFAEKPEPTPAPTPSGEPMVRAKGQVNIRSGPGKNYPKIGELKGTQTVELIDEEKGFYKVAVYVMKDFAEVID